MRFGGQYHLKYRRGLAHEELRRAPRALGMAPMKTPNRERSGVKDWWPRAESNHRHTDFQSAALPTELLGLNWNYITIKKMAGLAGVQPAIHTVRLLRDKSTPSCLSLR